MYGLRLSQRLSPYLSQRAREAWSWLRIYDWRRCLPWVQGTPRALEQLCQLQKDMAARLAAMRAQTAELLVEHINEPLFLKCPVDCLDQLSEMVYSFAGIIACFKARAPEDFGENAPITDLEYQVRPKTKPNV